jgi:cytolysin (calcineurin-like family phosphatase)
MKARFFFIFLLVATFTTVHAQEEEFAMIMMSDPQFPWTPEDDDNIEIDNDIKKAASRRLNNLHVSSANNIISSKYNVKGVIINGDLTAFGHSWQLDEFEQIYKELNVPMYPGLGNHDYANGVDNCAENHCANRMVKFMRDYVQKAGISNFDFQQSDSYEFPSLVRTIEGSLSYSWDIGNVHFVQCQNFPIYERKWSNYVTGEAKRYTIDIQNSLDWLRNDLAKARRAGKVIILNFHDPEQHWWDIGALHPKDPSLDMVEKAMVNGFKVIKDNLIKEFKSILEKYKVSAVFVGHYHKSIGRWQGANKEIYGSVPVFFCGSASQGQYLLVNFKGDKMTVEKILRTAGEVS